MNTSQTIVLEINDHPDVLVRIMQVIHRRSGRVRSLQVEPGVRADQVRLSVEAIENPLQISRSLEKLVGVHSVRFVTK